VRLPCKSIRSHKASKVQTSYTFDKAIPQCTATKQFAHATHGEAGHGTWRHKENGGMRNKDVAYPAIDKITAMKRIGLTRGAAQMNLAISRRFRRQLTFF
jgi:hypothetical protein